MRRRNLILSCVAALLMTGPAALASGYHYDIDVTGVQSWDGLGDASNTVMKIDLATALGFDAGTELTLNGVGWNVTLSTVGLSWLSEPTIYFDDNIAPDEDGLFLAPGIGDDGPGEASYSSFGIIKLGDVSLPDVVLPDGVLRIEFFEGFDDVADAVDANWSGTITVQVVPAPGALALIGVAGLTAARRRRRRRR